MMIEAPAIGRQLILVHAADAAAIEIAQSAGILDCLP
jgi:hypothetical protein